MVQLSKLRTYRRVKLTLEKEEYLETIADREERRRMTALRGGTNSLRIEVGRWKGAKMGLFCTRQTQINDSGYADVDWFRVDKN